MYQSSVGVPLKCSPLLRSSYKYLEKRLLLYYVRPFMTCTGHFTSSSIVYKPKSFRNVENIKKNCIFTCATLYGNKLSTVCYCGDVTLEQLGKQVTVRGFLQYQRMGQFCVLRDSRGLIQVLIQDEKVSSTLKNTSYESYIEVSGEVLARPESQVNKSMKTGEIELAAKEFTVLNKAKSDIPFLIRNFNKPNEMLGLKYRYLDLRHQYLQDNLRFRSKLCKKMRDFLQDEREFIELTTPTLSARTPGGAQEFVVPSQLENKFYSLVQSPQTYKQLAIIGGFEKYFQFAVCYRDEGGRPDRQPEFMQLDLEMSNASSSDVQDLTEEMVVSSWLNEAPVPSRPFPSLTYHDAMEDYGVDKPDTRFGWKIQDVSSAISLAASPIFTDPLKEGVAKAIVIPQGEKFIKKRDVKKWVNLARKEFEMGVALLGLKEGRLTGQASKALSSAASEALVETLGATEGDTIAMAVGEKTKVLKLLGNVRLSAAEVLEGAGVVVRPAGLFNFLWVVDFPLFESEASGQLASSHHPFTAPHPDHVQMLYSDPKKVRSQHYDLVLNGSEIGGGSIRIHDPEMQKHVLDILKLDSSSLGFLLEALASGAPPHGGIALGLDRYVTILRGAKSVREVMAFPKTSDGKCLMSEAPMSISEADRKLYNIYSKEIKK